LAFSIWYGGGNKTYAVWIGWLGVTALILMALISRARARGARRWRRELGGGVRQHPGSNNIHHDQRSNVFFSHFRDGIQNSCIRVNRPNFPTLLIKQLSHRGYWGPRSLSPNDGAAYAVRQLLTKAAVSSACYQVRKLRMTHMD